jgi:hypothetical protein
MHNGNKNALTPAAGEPYENKEPVTPRFLGTVMLKWIINRVLGCGVESVS